MTRVKCDKIDCLVDDRLIQPAVARAISCHHLNSKGDVFQSGFLQQVLNDRGGYAESECAEDAGPSGFPLLEW